MVFDNSVFGSIGRWQIVQEYGAHTGVPLNGSSGTIADPSHPSPDSIGMGKYTAGVQTFGDEPFYFFNNTRTDGTDMQLLGSTVSAAAIAQYGSTFVMTSPEGSPYMLLHGRDYLNGLAHGTFPSTSKVGRGTKAQMLASSPTAARQGWWVTDEASWNTTVAPNTSGQLYQWNGSSWVLYYTPYTYPHPLQTSPTFAPTITVNPISQSVAAGANATFIADATGSPTPTWQWSKGGVPIGGATNSTYVITGVVGGDSGNYSATATNSSGSATTTTATLTVTSSPSPATGVPSTPVITGIAPYFYEHPKYPIHGSASNRVHQCASRAGCLCSDRHASWTYRAAANLPADC